MARFVETQEDYWVNVEKIVQFEIVETNKNFKPYEIHALFEGEKESVMLTCFDSYEEAKEFAKKLIGVEK